MSDKRFHTGDLGGKALTLDVGNAVVARIRPHGRGLRKRIRRNARKVRARRAASLRGGSPFFIPKGSRRALFRTRKSLSWRPRDLRLTTHGSRPPAGGQRELSPSLGEGEVQVLVRELRRPAAVLHPGDEADLEQKRLHHVDEGVRLFLKGGGDRLQPHGSAPVIPDDGPR